MRNGKGTAIRSNREAGVSLYEENLKATGRGTADRHARNAIQSLATPLNLQR